MFIKKDKYDAVTDALLIRSRHIIKFFCQHYLISERIKYNSEFRVTRNKHAEFWPNFITVTCLMMRDYLKNPGSATISLIFTLKYFFPF